MGRFFNGKQARERVCNALGTTRSDCPFGYPGADGYATNATGDTGSRRRRKACTLAHSFLMHLLLN